MTCSCPESGPSAASRSPAARRRPRLRGSALSVPSAPVGSAEPSRSPVSPAMPLSDACDHAVSPSTSREAAARMARMSAGTWRQPSRSDDSARQVTSRSSSASAAGSGAGNASATRPSTLTRRRSSPSAPSAMPLSWARPAASARSATATAAASALVPSPTADSGTPGTQSAATMTSVRPRCTARMRASPGPSTRRRALAASEIFTAAPGAV